MLSTHRRAVTAPSLLIEVPSLRKRRCFTPRCSVSYGKILPERLSRLRLFQFTSKRGRPRANTASDDSPDIGKILRRGLR
ncbi:hypothetical protein PROFUN_00105 [Planoprotostelium fungivorum]|uniref:Uncharacterized protein n=1 Tax=Planoprotostelium fungivorum TaxID=1890364 RepID=A0A2P6P0N4_9EUKA|nr:hypothetical protein PROFUN_00105 [Planoprotostelium fungivorum]